MPRDGTLNSNVTRVIKGVMDERPPPAQSSFVYGVLSGATESHIII